MQPLTREIYLDLREGNWSKREIRQKYSLSRAELYALLADWSLDTAMGEVAALREYTAQKLSLGAEVRTPKALRRKLGRDTVLVPVDVFSKNINGTGSVQLALDFNGETIWEIRRQGAEWEPSRLVAAAMLYQSQRAHGAPSTKAIAAVTAAVGVSPAATYQRLKTVGIIPRDHKKSKIMRRYYRSKKKQATRCAVDTSPH
ncbi:MAG: hypothetical protein IMW91_08600 [Firmicutes bacterium]|nr:hypothetical protein [Bacillota bacterium]